MRPIVQVDTARITEAIIKRVALMLTYTTDLSEIRNNLASDNLSEDELYLAVHAAHTYSMGEPVEYEKHNLPNDYETCGQCGLDHEYEPQESYQAHLHDSVG